MKPRSWWAIGAGAYLAFALITLPAGTAYRWFAPEDVNLAGLRGTVWSGQASTGVIASIAVHDIRWDVVPWALLLGRVAGSVELRFAEGFASTHVSATPRTISLSELRASTDLSSLGAAMPSAAVGAEGLASLAFDSLRFASGWPVDADGELRLSELAVPPLFATGTPTPVPLGEYRVVFTPTGGEGLSASVNDAGGPLEVSGTLRLEPDRSYELQGYARPRPDADPMLTQGLQLMGGDADAAGRRQFNLSGSL